MPRGLPTGKTGRRSDGTFAPGNAGGPGRPPAATVHEHRAAMVGAVTPDDVAATGESSRSSRISRIGVRFCYDESFIQASRGEPEKRTKTY